MRDEKVLIIGGNAAGMTAASRAKRLCPSLDVRILEAGSRIAYSICGLPYFLGGRVAALSQLELFTPESLANERGIEARVRRRAVELLPSQRKVVAEDTGTGARETLGYDRLLLATGYRPLTPDIEGIALEGVFTASRLRDAEAIRAWIASRGARRAVLVGGGYVGLEMAEALVSRGLEVTLVEKAPRVLASSIDPDMGEMVEAELVRHGVQVMTGRQVKRVAANGRGEVEAIELEAGSLRLPADIVFVDVGVAPAVDLALRAGIDLGPSGAIAVDEHLETSAPGVFAAGNCAESWHVVSGRPAPSLVGTVAAKQGRIAGENLAGRRSRFHGSVGTSLVKVFDLSVARTGLSASEAADAGFDVVSSRIEGRFQADYFGGAKATVKVLADRGTSCLLGAQIVGSKEGVLRIDVAATALSARMRVAEASQLDLAYAPHAGALWNPLLIALNTLSREL